MLVKLYNIEKWLIASACFLPFTLLRFSAIGLGELLIVILFITEIVKQSRSVFSITYFFSKFWIFYIIASLFGFIYNVFILEHDTGTIQSMLFDLSAYFFVFMLAYIIESNSKTINFYNLLVNLFIFLGTIYGILFLLSFFLNDIFGFTLVYFDYFAPLVSNLHQTSMIVSPLFFMGLFILKSYSCTFREKFYIIILTFLLALMTIATGSFKAYIGLLLGGFMFVFISILGLLHKNIKPVVILVIFICIFIYIAFDFVNIITIIGDIFKEEDLNDGRNNIYSKALDLINSSLIFGRGAGSHIYFNGIFVDAHQTFFTILLQTGTVGFIVSIYVFFKITKQVLKTPYLFPVLIPIFIYAIGGDILRRLPIWFILIIVYYLSIQKTSKL